MYLPQLPQIKRFMTLHDFLQTVQPISIISRVKSSIEANLTSKRAAVVYINSSLEMRLFRRKNSVLKACYIFRGSIEWGETREKHGCRYNKAANIKKEILVSHSTRKHVYITVQTTRLEAVRRNVRLVLNDNQSTCILDVLVILCRSLKDEVHFQV